MAHEPNNQESKVAQLIEAYDLEGLGAELEAAWTGEGGERKSLRELEEEFNLRLMEQALRDAGQQTLERDVETLYQNLTDEDVSAGVKTELRNRLEADGVDVETLESSFVSYQAIRSYLKNYRGADYEGPTDAEKLSRDRDTIQRLMTRTRSVAEKRLEQSRDTDRLNLAEFDAFVSLEILCQRCGTLHNIDELLDNGGCDCLSDTGKE